MPGAPIGPALRSTSTSSARTSRSGESIRVVMSSTESKTTARPVCCKSAGVAADCLMIAPRGARLPRSTAMLPLALRRAADIARVEVEQVGELVDEARHAAGPVEVLHVVAPRRLEVDQHRHFAAELVDLVEVDRDAEAPRGRR